MGNAFIYTDAYLDYDYGPTHPLRIIRLKLTYELIRAYGLLDLPSVKFIHTVKANDDDLALFHGRDYDTGQLGVGPWQAGGRSLTRDKLEE